MVVKIICVSIYNECRKVVEMSCFNKFDKKEKFADKTLRIDEELYNELSRLWNDVYMASINKLVNSAIEDLVKKENIVIYQRKNALCVTRSFCIKESLIDKLADLKAKYRLSINLLVNIAIRNALLEEERESREKNIINV